MLKQYNLLIISVPNYLELSVKNMYFALKDDEVVSQYIPDYGDKMIPDKEFFHKLIWTLYPAEMYDFIEQAHKHRRVDKADNDGKFAEVSEKIFQKIENIILLPSN